MKQIELTVTVRNNLIKSRRVALKMSQKRLAFAAEVPLYFITAAERLVQMRGPQCASFQEKLALFFDVDVIELFPPELDTVKKNKTVKWLDYTECRQLLRNTEATRRLLIESGISEAEPEKAEQQQVIEQVLKSTLTEREAAMIRMRFGTRDSTPHSLEEIGRTFNIGRQRAMQVVNKAIRKLQHPSRSRILADMMQGTNRINSLGLK